MDMLVAEHDGREVTIGGTIGQLRNFITKKGDKMVFLTIEDKVATMEVIVFPKLFKEVGTLLEIDKIVAVRGRINSKDREGNLGSPKVIANEITELTEDVIKAYEPTWRDKRHLKISPEYLPEEIKQRSSKQKAKPKKFVNVAKAAAAASVSVALSSPPKTILYLKLHDNYKSTELEAIRRICQANPGNDIVVLVLDGASKSALKLPFKVDAKSAVVDDLKKLLGVDAVLVSVKS